MIEHHHVDGVVGQGVALRIAQLEGDPQPGLAVLQRGDEVRVRTTDRVLRYEVTGVRIYRKARIARDAEQLFSQSRAIFQRLGHRRGVAGLLGRLSVSGSLWPRWLPPDGRRAVHLVTQHLLLWSVVVIPIATIWLLLDDGAEVALYSVIWGPTVALGAFAMGHVVDFIQLPNFAIFNIADSGITLGVICILLDSLRRERAT